MKHRLLAAPILLLAMFGNASTLAGQMIEYAGPKCLGPACINRKSSLGSLFAQVGAPPTKGVPYCYRAKDGRASLAIAVVRGELTDLDLNSSGECDARFPSRSTPVNLYGWKTAEGIRLGSPVEDVFKAYGKPYREVPGTYNPRIVEEPPAQVREGEFFYWGTLQALPVTGIPFEWWGVFSLRAGRVSRIDLQEENIYSGPLQLGLFAIDRSVSLSSLFKGLGPPPRSWRYCYSSPAGGAFLAIAGIHEESGKAGEVLLSDFPNCLHMPVKVSAADLREWRTPEGIGLGSTEEEVLKAYGKPASKGKTGPKGYAYLLGDYRQGEEVPYIEDEYLDYDGLASWGETNVAIFGLRKGKVSYIFLSKYAG